MTQLELAARYRQIMRRVAASAGARKVTLIAVSKGQPEDAIFALYHLGHRDFGENYVQELSAKARNLAARGCPDIRWHFIGHLQTNKVKALMPIVHAVHSVDSVKLAQELAKRSKPEGRSGKLPVFVEVNIEGEPTKSGYAPGAVPEACARIAELPELELRGLMCIPSPGSSAGGAESPFQKLRELEATCRPHTHGELSMGMSDDFELAIREGSTHVRVGTALFGVRPAKSAAEAQEDSSPDEET